MVEGNVTRRREQQHFRVTTLFLHHWSVAAVWSGGREGRGGRGRSAVFEEGQGLDGEGGGGDGDEGEVWEADGGDGGPGVTLSCPAASALFVFLLTAS